MLQLISLDKSRVNIDVSDIHEGVDVLEASQSHEQRICISYTSVTMRWCSAACMLSVHDCGVDDHVQSRGAGSSSNLQLKTALQYSPIRAAMMVLRLQDHEASAVFIMILNQKRGSRRDKGLEMA